MCLERVIFVICVGLTLGLHSTQHASEPTLAVHRPGALLLYSDRSVNALMYNMTEWASIMPQLSSKQKEALTVTNGAARNICMGDHHVPELFVIGAIKAATTTLCADLCGSPGVEWPLGKAALRNDTVHRAAWKEGHFFDTALPITITDMENNYSPCHRDVRFVAAEGSARYSTDPEVPNKISHAYGQSKGALTFVMLLREPLARLQSHFYHSKRDGWCKLHKFMNFNAFVRSLLVGQFLGLNALFLGGSKGPTGSGCGDVLQGSLYKDQLEEWFSFFNPSQFIVVPFLYAAAPGQDGRTPSKVAEYIWDFLGVKGIVMPIATHANKIEHPKLEHDTDAASLENIHKFFDEKTGPSKLAGILANSGAKLYEYKGSLSDEKSIAGWIADNW